MSVEGRTRRTGEIHVVEAPGGIRRAGPLGRTGAGLLFRVAAVLLASFAAALGVHAGDHGPAT